MGTTRVQSISLWCNRQRPNRGTLSYIFVFVFAFAFVFVFVFVSVFAFLLAKHQCLIDMAKAEQRYTYFGIHITWSKAYLQFHKINWMIQGGNAEGQRCWGPGKTGANKEDLCCIWSNLLNWWCNRCKQKGLMRVFLESDLEWIYNWILDVRRP